VASISGDGVIVADIVFSGDADGSVGDIIGLAKETLDFLIGITTSEACGTDR